MPLFDRVKALFSRKGDDEKKISFLSERRAALCQQRDRAYEEMGALEGRESDLRQQFKETTGNLTKRRITGQLLQLRKDIERRQQILGVLNQQINVVSTHLHNLELVQQGRGAQLPTADEMTEDAVKAEEVLAELEATHELADTTGSITTGGMSAEEQALFEELEREAKGEPDRLEAREADQEAGTSSPAPEPARPQREKGQASSTMSASAPPERAPRRSEPEAG